MLVLPSAVLRRLAAAVTLAAVVAVLLPVGRAEAAAPVSALGARTGFAPGAGLLWEPDDVLARELDLMVSSGAGWLRLDFDWGSVEHTRGRYDWKNLDRVVSAARSRGLQVLALPTYTPEWARPAGTTSHHPPADPAAFAAFVAAAAERFVPAGVTHYEIWNEPNIPNFWEPGPDVRAYARLLRATAAAVRARVPQARLVSGGLSPSVDSPDGRYVDPRTFLSELYRLGAGDSFDAVGIHPYSFPAMPSDVKTASWNTFQKMTTMYETMVRHGDGDKKIWMTETGAPTGTSAQAVTEQAQADTVADTLRSVSLRPWAGPVFFYSARDAGTDPTDREDNFGLVRRDFTPKPAWGTLVRALAPAAATPADPAPAAGPVTAPVAGPASVLSPVDAPVPPPVSAPVAESMPVLPTPARVASRLTLRSVTTTWEPSPGAASYLVERTTTAPGASGRTWTTLGRTTSAAFADSAVRPGVRYWYRVIATARSLSSAASAEGTARVVTLAGHGRLSTKRSPLTDPRRLVG